MFNPRVHLMLKFVFKANSISLELLHKDGKVERDDCFLVSVRQHQRPAHLNIFFFLGLTCPWCLTVSFTFQALEFPSCWLMSMVWCPSHCAVVEAVVSQLGMAKESA